jgi:hypothetical protein
MVNRTRKYIGFNPIFIAIFWLPLEYVLIHHTGLGNIFVFKNSDSWFVHRFSWLFGFLMFSFFIVLTNSLILMFVEYVEEKVLSNGDYPVLKDINVYNSLKEIVNGKSCFFLSEPRGPPSNMNTYRHELSIDIILND